MPLRFSLVLLRINVALAIFQPYRDLEAGDNQSLKFKWRGGESNPGPLAPQAKSLTTRPPLLLRAVTQNGVLFLSILATGQEKKEGSAQSYDKSPYAHRQTQKAP